MSPSANERTSPRWSQTWQPPSHLAFQYFVETFWESGFRAWATISFSAPINLPCLTLMVQHWHRDFCQQYWGLGLQWMWLCGTQFNHMKVLCPHQSTRWVFSPGLRWDLYQKAKENSTYSQKTPTPSTIQRCFCLKSVPHFITPSKVMTRTLLKEMLMAETGRMTFNQWSKETVISEVNVWLYWCS